MEHSYSVFCTLHSKDDFSHRHDCNAPRYIELEQWNKSKENRTSNFNTTVYQQHLIWQLSQKRKWRSGRQWWWWWWWCLIHASTCKLIWLERAQLFNLNLFSYSIGIHTEGEGKRTCVAGNAFSLFNWFMLFSNLIRDDLSIMPLKSKTSDLEHVASSAPRPITATDEH